MIPLYDLLKQENSEQKAKTGKPKNPWKMKKGHQYDANNRINWNSNLQKILDGMIDNLKSPEMVAYHEFNLPFL